jgi:anti-sigma regulatory factor (Ser/Thr protein kinase)
MSSHHAMIKSAPLQLRLPVGPDMVESARLAVAAYLAPCRPGPRTVYSLELVLEEVLMNLVMHTNLPAQAAWVDLVVEAMGSEREIRLRVEDGGEPFDPTRQQVRPRPARLDDADPGGLGLMLVRQYVSAMRYGRQDGRNVLHLVIPMPD